MRAEVTGERPHMVTVAVSQGPACAGAPAARTRSISEAAMSVFLSAWRN